MGEGEENPLDAAERRARETRRSAEEAKQRGDAEVASVARSASEEASALIDRCRDRLAEAGPDGQEIMVQEQGSEAVGLLRRQQRPRVNLVKHEV